MELSHIAWNVLLAVIPTALAFAIAGGIRRDRANGRVRWVLWAVPLAVWLAFQPNTCYLLTEWRHYLAYVSQHPQWIWLAPQSASAMYEFLAITGFYAVYTTVGTTLFFLSIWPLDREIRPLRALKALFFMACSLGVYLGLVRRLNSGDLRHPERVFSAAMTALANAPLAVLIAVFGLMLWGLYFVFSLTMDGLPAPGASADGQYGGHRRC